MRKTRKWNCFHYRLKNFSIRSRKANIYSYARTVRKSFYLYIQVYIFEICILKYRNIYKYQNSFCSNYIRCYNCYFTIARLKIRWKKKNRFNFGWLTCSYNVIVRLWYTLHVAAAHRTANKKNYQQVQYDRLNLITIFC